MANRSFNDLSQYPVFPWIIKDYQVLIFNQSEQLDLHNSQIYRDLSQPIGCLNKHRLKKLKDLKLISKNNKAHLFPNFYSTPCIVTYYMIRKVPQLLMRVQNGILNTSDKIFRSIQYAFFSSMNLPSDFKELIPQYFQFYRFYYDHSFLVNTQNFQLGYTSEGKINNDVIIPKWASDPLDFVMKMRAALESNLVSGALNLWIDLIFGQKSCGKMAASYDNLFSQIVYESNVNVKSLPQTKKRVFYFQVSEFGQLPVQLFLNKHIERKIKILYINQRKNLKLTEQSKQMLKMYEQENQKLREQKETIIRKLNNKIIEQEQNIQELQKIAKHNIKKVEKDKTSPLYLTSLQIKIKKLEQQKQKLTVQVNGFKKQIFNKNNISVDSYVSQQIKQGDTNFFKDQF